MAEGDKTELDSSEWQDDHHLVGKRVLRFFPGFGQAHGTVTGWVPATGKDDEPALWRISHDDGDVEDCSEEEVLAAVSNALSCTPLDEAIERTGDELVSMVKRHGDMAPECCTAYIAYGEAILRRTVVRVPSCVK